MTPELARALEELSRVPKQTLVEVVRGFSVKRKANGIPVGRIHYSADPDRDPATPAGKAWYDMKRLEYDSNKSGWEREYEIVDEAGGGERVFADILTRYGSVIVIRDPAWAPNPEWGVVGGFDHGSTNPTTLEKCYIDHEGNKYFAGEFYRYKTKDWDNTIASNTREILGLNEAGEPTGKGMPDLKRMRWINADPSIFWDQEPTKEGQLVAAASIYRNLGLSLRKYEGERSDLAVVQRIQDDLWGQLHSQKPKMYIVCRNESDARQPGLHPYDSPNLLWEVKRIRRAELTARQLMTQNQTEKVVDKDNHAFDAAFKYVVMQFPKSEPIPPAKQLEKLIEGLNATSAQIAAERFISRLGKSSKVGRFDIRNKKRMGR
jgi:hypothetical protein